MADIPDELIKLERSAEDARTKLAGLDGTAYDAQWKAWRDAAADFQAAVTEYAGREDVSTSRYELEQAVKKAVRHAVPEG
ncbi:hypothetical protein [Streptomyces sp. NPDC001401]|uniref:hypothetical protein n=1 Tax=Streptomyces sp. NPDC001401 TaxID=3364570 RepID=UPI0036ADA7FA